MDGLPWPRPLRVLVSAVALLSVLALVGGVRPRVLAQESGVAPLSSSACFLCNGAPTAAAVTPAADTVSLPAPAFAPATALAEAAVALTVPTGPERGGTPPLVPPPRA